MANIKRILYYLFPILAAIHIGWIIPGHDKYAAAELVDRIVAVVNDEVISLYELKENLKPYLDQIKNAQYSEEQEKQMVYTIRQRILEQLINQKLADQELERLNITVSDKEVDNAIERIKSDRFITDEELREGLEQQDLSYEEYRNRIREQLLRSKLVNYEIKSKIVVTRDDIKDYYEKHQEDYRGEKQYHLKQIAMTFSNQTNASEKRRVMEKMQMLYRELESGDRFDDIAEKYRDDPAVQHSGDLGAYNLDELSPMLQEILKNMTSGQYTPIIETDLGFQILYIDEIVESGGKSFEEASAEIREKLYAERVDRSYHAWLEDLKDRSHIKIVN